MLLAAVVLKPRATRLVDASDHGIGQATSYDLAHLFWCEIERATKVYHVLITTGQHASDLASIGHESTCHATTGHGSTNVATLYARDDATDGCVQDRTAHGQGRAWIGYAQGIAQGQAVLCCYATTRAGDGRYQGLFR